MLDLCLLFRGTWVAEFALLLSYGAKAGPNLDIVEGTLHILTVKMSRRKYDQLDYKNIDRYSLTQSD